MIRAAAGYTLATNSCERVSNVAHNRRSPRCDHRFCGPKPQQHLAALSVFSGLGVRRVTSVGESPSLLRIGNVLGNQSFRSSTTTTLIIQLLAVNA